MIFVGGFSERLQGAVQEFVDDSIDGLEDLLVGFGVEFLHRLFGEQTQQFRIANQVGLVPQSTDGVPGLS